VNSRPHSSATSGVSAPATSICSSMSAWNGDQRCPVFYNIFMHLRPYRENGAQQLILDNRGYQKAIQEVTGLRLKLAQTFQEVDVLVTPSAAGPAPRTLDATGSAAFNSAWSLAGNPVITLPLFRSKESGMPIGCQIIAGYAEDDLLLAASKELMSEFGRQ
jgi:Asp-tRNA(Asn)/Glu-tRNA(Gln) amidotransferase A subunit family amidase